MDLNIVALKKIFGMLLVVLGLSMLIPTVVGLIYQDHNSVVSFLKTILPCLFIGVFLIISTPHSKDPFRIREGLITVSATWLLASLIGALPFVLSGAIPNYVDAFFETASGFSTTGSSILTDIEALPKAMLFWRSFTHWLGGMGIVVLAVALLPTLGIGGQFILQAEAPGPTLSKVTPKIKDTAKILYTVYLVFTATETVLLLAGGLSLFDALTHTFATVGTGGFSTYNEGIAAFNSPYVESVLTLFMILCGASFILYYSFIRRGPGLFLKNTEFKTYIAFIFFVTVILTVALSMDKTYDSVLEAFRYSLFQVSSIITTTGFATADFILWPTFCQLLLFLLFFCGGCSASTGGGVKVIRILIMFKFVRRTIALKLHPHYVAKVKLDGKTISGDTVSQITSFFLLYIGTLFVGTILISIDNLDLVSSFSAVATCLGNIGPGLNQVGPMSNFSEFSEFSKVVLAIIMIAGRLELYTFFMLFARRFWNPYR